MYWLIPMGFVLVVAVGVMLLYRSEKRAVQQGHCGLPWVAFDTASDGSTGLKCQRCNTYGPWVSYYRKGICYTRWT